MSATIRTYTATPCGPTPLPSYEVAITQAGGIPVDNLAAVRIATNPDQWTCCAVNRKTVNNTPSENVYYCQDSGYGLTECAECNDHW